jgi:hypothetical protein
MLWAQTSVADSGVSDRLRQTGGLDFHLIVGVAALR